jgi:hypothetical protein
LDVLFETPLYQQLINLPIESPFTKSERGPLQVYVPSLEDILGDKLTAFAPNTTGIPYFKNGDSMAMEIIKQLYDIGKVFDSVQDIEIVKKTFHAFAAIELKYRNQPQLNEEDVLNDIFQTSLSLISRGVAGEGDFTQLLSGIQRVSRFIFSESFHIEKAITLASKSAYLASSIRNDAQLLQRFEHPSQIQDWQMHEPAFSRINRLKKTDPEAFFYCYKAYDHPSPP